GPTSSLLSPHSGLFLGSWWCVVGVHGTFETVREDGFDGFGGAGQGFVYDFPLAFVETTKHPIHLAALEPDGAVHAYAQAGEVLGAQVLDDAGYAVVPARRAFSPDAYGAQGQGDVVVNHQHALQGDLVVTGQRAHRLAAQVHVGAGLGEN